MFALHENFEEVFFAAHHVDMIFKSALCVGCSFITHISEIRSSCLMKLSSKLFQNLTLFLEIFFLVPKIWQILKHFARSFYQA